MYGAILGDIIGSPYEFDRSGKTKQFPLFSSESRFTDDTVMTIAVADAFLKLSPGTPDDHICNQLIQSMQHFGRAYPTIGYGAKFLAWLMTDSPRPYGSWGNGSAMRVSAVGWIFDDLDTVLKMASLSATVSHDHPEAVKGAQATAAAVFLARTGHTKTDIKAYIEHRFVYDLSRTCDQIRPGYRHDVSCRGTVPEAITAFLEGQDFEDVIRTAVSLGGDCDTLTCIAGAMAEGFYGVPDHLKEICRSYLPPDLLDVVIRFEQRTAHR